MGTDRRLKLERHPMGNDETSRWRSLCTPRDRSGLKRFDVGVALICTLGGGDQAIRNGGRSWPIPGGANTVLIGLIVDF